MAVIGLLVVVIGIVLLFPAIDRALEQVDIKKNLGSLEDEE